MEEGEEDSRKGEEGRGPGSYMERKDKKVAGKGIVYAMVQPTKKI